MVSTFHSLNLLNQLLNQLPNQLLKQLPNHLLNQLLNQLLNYLCWTDVNTLFCPSQRKGWISNCCLETGTGSENQAMIDEHFYIDDDPRKAFSRDAWKLLQVLIQGQTGENRADSDGHLSLCQTARGFQVIVQLQVLNELTRSLCDWGPSNSSRVRSSALKKKNVFFIHFISTNKKMN